MRLTPALAALDPSDRAAVVRFLDAMGFDLHELDAVPGLAGVVEVLACLALLDDFEEDGSREAAFREAADCLGLNGSTILKRLDRWTERAWTKCREGSGGQ